MASWLFVLLLSCVSNSSAEDIGWQETKFDNSNEEISWQDRNSDTTAMKPRLLKDVPPSVDTSKFRGVRIATDQSIMTLGEKQEIKYFRYFVCFYHCVIYKRQHC